MRRLLISCGRSVCKNKRGLIPSLFLYINSGSQGSDLGDEGIKERLSRPDRHVTFLFLVNSLILATFTLRLFLILSLQFLLTLSSLISSYLTRYYSLAKSINAITLSPFSLVNLHKSFMQMTRESLRASLSEILISSIIQIRQIKLPIYLSNFYPSIII